jgi:membrane glycosyltransferase
MPWLFLAIAAALLAVALTSTSMAIMVVCMLVSLGLTVFSVMILIADRVGSASRSETLLIDPQELRRLREQAEARRNGTAGAAVVVDADPVPVTGQAEPPQP